MVYFSFKCVGMLGAGVFWLPNWPLLDYLWVPSCPEWRIASRQLAGYFEHAIDTWRKLHDNHSFKQLPPDFLPSQAPGNSGRPCSHFHPGQRGSTSPGGPAEGLWLVQTPEGWPWLVQTPLSDPLSGFISRLTLCHLADTLLCCPLALQC
jgi:hypothetical protein